MFPEIPAEIAYERWLADNGEELRLAYNLPENAVVFDIGAHVGDWARDILARHDCEIHLFEPMPEFANEARERYKDNPKVHVHNFALLDYNGTADLALFGTGSSLYSKSDNAIEVAVRDIGEVMAELNITRVDLAKINIEGAEFDLLDYLIGSGLITLFDELQIQFHDVFENAVDRRFRIQKALSQTFDPTYNYAFIWENWVRRRKSVRGYEYINAAVARQGTRNGWDTAAVATIQHAAFQPLLRGMKAGAPRRDLEVLAAAVQQAGAAGDVVLEVGCGSGYMSEVVRAARPDLGAYLGLDSAASMIGLAQAQYPDCEFMVGQANALPFTDKSVDLVINGVSLMHTRDYPLAIAESARVARKYCLFHTVPVHRVAGTTYLRKLAYGQPVVELNFNEGELLALMANTGLSVVNSWDSLVYDLSDVVGEATPTRTYLCAVSSPEIPVATDGALINIGCGRHVASGWLNYDIAPQLDGIVAHDVTHPLPVEDGSAAMVYHSHVLEHLPRAQAPAFLADCFRVLRPGGVLRVVVPDLETICRLYLSRLARGIEGNAAAIDQHTWLQIELLDQMVREESGGEMLRYWQQNPIPERSFMWTRIGEEARPMVDHIHKQALDQGMTGAGSPLFAARPRPSGAAMALFQQSGEKHLWMYDRLSLRQLLESCGFVGCRVVDAGQSAMPVFPAALEVMPDGKVRKPDSLFMEAFRPAV